MCSVINEKGIKFLWTFINLKVFLLIITKLNKHHHQHYTDEKTKTKHFCHIKIFFVINDEFLSFSSIGIHSWKNLSL